MAMNAQLQAEIDKKRRELEEAINNLALAESKPIEIRLAEDLHEKMCHWDHTEGCFWFYRANDWDEGTHKEYLKKAKAILEFTDYDTAMKVVEIAR